MMKKERTFALIVMGLVALFLAGGVVVADVENNPLVTTFEGNRCNCERIPGTTTYPDGRTKIKGQTALYSVDVGPGLVTGNWWNDMMVNWDSGRSGTLHGKFEILPDSMCDGEMVTDPDNPKCGDYCAGEYLGYWEGTWVQLNKFLSSDQTSLIAFIRGQGKGVGLLEGLKIKFDTDNPYPGGGSGCGDVGTIFTGYVIETASYDGE